MTLLGYRNPLRRVSNAVRVLIRRPASAGSRRRIFVIGHRGAARHEAENTLPSFAILDESRREPLGGNVWIVADFELPGALEVAARFGARRLSFGVRRRLWAVFCRELAETLAARDAGRIDSVFAWTINEEDRMRELVTLGVDGIVTDDPKLPRRVVEERRKNE